jgi:hypothetical protein
MPRSQQYKNKPFSPEAKNLYHDGLLHVALPKTHDCLEGVSPDPNSVILDQTSLPIFSSPTSPMDPEAPNVLELRRPTTRQMRILTALLHHGLRGLPYLFRRNPFG